MMVFLIATLVVVVACVIGIVVGKVGTKTDALDTMDEATRTSAFELPDGRLGSAGMDQVRLDQSLRGYNMVQVDAVLDKLFDELKELEDENRRLRGQSGSTRTASVHPIGARAEERVIVATDGSHQPDAAPFDASTVSEPSARGQAQPRRIRPADGDAE